jgi:copper resistance protein B
MKLMRFHLALCALLLSAPLAAAVPGAGDVPPAWPDPIEDDAPYGLLLIDRLEYSDNEGPNTLDWEALGWFGGDVNRLWLNTEGAQRLQGAGREIERLDVSYGRLIAPFWDLQLGVGTQRIDRPGPDAERYSVVASLVGLAPGWFEVDANLRLSEAGGMSANLEAEYELLLTQRLVLQPRFETLVASERVPAFGVGEGLNSVALGLRLRYEIRRQLAPYVGLQWTRRYGESADLARAEHEAVADTAWVAGLRLWF